MLRWAIRYNCWFMDMSWLCVWMMLGRLGFLFVSLNRLQLRWRRCPASVMSIPVTVKWVVLIVELTSILCLALRYFRLPWWVIRIVARQLCLISWPVWSNMWATSPEWRWIKKVGLSVAFLIHWWPIYPVSIRFHLIRMKKSYRASLSWKKNQRVSLTLLMLPILSAIFISPCSCWN